MKKKGFTLLELMAVVIIVSILASIAMPIYTRSIERSRAVEAMTNIKSINDAVYVYYADKEKCPTAFKQLVATVPIVSGDLEGATVTAKFFTFQLGRSLAQVPGTPCRGVVAERYNGGDYQYSIWNPYAVASGQAASLACFAATTKGKSICDALGLADGGDGSSGYNPFYEEEE